jgi:hypothetical protein
MDVVQQGIAAQKIHGPADGRHDHARHEDALLLVNLRE